MSKITLVTDATEQGILAKIKQEIDCNPDGACKIGDCPGCREVEIAVTMKDVKS